MSGLLTSWTSTVGFFGGVLEGRLGDVEDGLAFSRLRQFDDHLAGADHLPGIGADRADDPVIVGFEIGVVEFLAGLDLAGARGIEPEPARS